ncbi:MAG: (Fe-S)-binding protein [Candidatus Rokuibacteriota bacterium]|nr:MAG: (Fe-S)-binding protein [Candidatus Rokubacteria bacterium]
MSERETAFVASLDERVSEIVDSCSRCGRCVEVCPTAGPANVDRRDPQAVVGQVIDILRGAGDPDSEGARWAQTCTGSGACIEACDDGVNPRFMLAMARVKLHQRRPPETLREAGLKNFQTMSQGVRVMSRLQLPSEFLGNVTHAAQAAAPAQADVVMYLGCNVLKTPHIALLCLDVLDRLGTRYRVFGGPANCCGVIQFRAGDVRSSARVGVGTVNGFAGTGIPHVLTWCPTCNIQLGEILMPSTNPGFSLEHVVPYIADRLDRLTPQFVRRVERRVALHEHPGVRGVTEGVVKILRAIPGLELVELDQPRVGYMCNSLAPVMDYKRELHAQELGAAAAAGVDCLVGIYHACHRELCAHERDYPFRIVNFLELVGEAMGLEKPDLFKQWKVMQDVDRAIAELGDRIGAAGLDVATVRRVMSAHVLGELPLPLGQRPA